MSRLARANHDLDALRRQVAQTHRALSQLDRDLSEHDHRWRRDCRAGLTPAHLAIARAHHQRLSSSRADLKNRLDSLLDARHKAQQAADHARQRLEQHREAMRRFNDRQRRSRRSRAQRVNDELAAYQAWRDSDPEPR